MAIDKSFITKPLSPTSFVDAPSPPYLTHQHRPAAQQILFIARVGVLCEWSADKIGDLVAKSRIAKLPTASALVALRPTFIDPGPQTNTVVHAVAELASVEGLSVEEMKRVVAFASTATNDTSFSRKVVERLAETSQVVKMAMALGGQG